MSIIADALRKAEQSGSSPPAPRAPRSIWLYRLVLLGSVALVLAGLAKVTRPRSAPTRPAKPSPTAPRLLPASSQGPQQTGLQLLQIARHNWALNGTVRGGGGRPMAIINNQLVEEGGRIEGTRLVRVEANSVVLEDEAGRTNTLHLAQD